MFLEIADVHDYARVKLNGKELEGHAWQPYRWEVTNVVKPGSNDLEVEVRATEPAAGAQALRARVGRAVALRHRPFPVCLAPFD